MQVDMHYYGVYCIARSAGMNRSAAKTVAYASQYVDDSNIREITTHENGSKAISETTAHHTTDVRNIDQNDQRYVWVPFHFYPAGEGTVFTERLICRKDSRMVNEMVQSHMKLDRPFILELMGIAAHVYADTFAHYGFSGVSSRKNRVVGSSLKVHGLSPTITSLLGKKTAQWFKKYGEQGSLMQNFRSFISSGTELATGALGHGGVSIYPDQPYLEWEFEYEYDTPSLDKISTRKNHETFLEACIKMHHMFVEFLDHHPEYKEEGMRSKIDKITPRLKDILSTVGDKEERIAAWKKYASEGLLYGTKENIPDYDAKSWQNQYNKFEKLTSHKDFAKMNIYRFFQAASYHKHYTLRELLPSKGILII